MSAGWRIVYTAAARKDKRRAFEAGLGDKIQRLLDLLHEDPFAPYPRYEKLVGDLTGLYSRRINRQHRLVYMVYPEERAVKIISLWTHYE